MDGVLFALCFRDGAWHGLPPSALADWTPQQGPLWVHCHYAHPRLPSWLGRAGVPLWAARALTQADTRPRVAPAEGGLLAFFRGANLNPGAAPEDMISLRAWLTADCLISCQRRPLRAVDDVAERLRDGANTVATPAAVLVALVDTLVWNLEQVVDQLEAEVAAYDERVQSEQRRSLLDDISRVRRRVMTMRRFLTPQRDALLKLAEAPQLADVERGVVREALDRLQRLLEDLDMVREQCVIAQEDLSNRLAAALNQRMYLLGLVSSVFLPLSFLTGLLGVNLGGIPGAESPWGFVAFSLMLLGVGAAIAVLLRRWRWL
ncbi:zinc transporter ZntB [Isoalcanivorax beigongshangi]|uniref:Zinc transporter ZntB n=1 Tax=Isoalcanivorax beigongshangi TaxID=3238810 RepID=A0ABV4AHA5_9GAMM